MVLNFLDLSCIEKAYWSVFLFVSSCKNMSIIVAVLVLKLNDSVPKPSHFILVLTITPEQRCTFHCLFLNDISCVSQQCLIQAQTMKGTFLFRVPFHFQHRHTHQGLLGVSWAYLLQLVFYGWLFLFNLKSTWTKKYNTDEMTFFQLHLPYEVHVDDSQSQNSSKGEICSQCKSVYNEFRRLYGLRGDNSNHEKRWCADIVYGVS